MLKAIAGTARTRPPGLILLGGALLFLAVPTLAQGSGSKRADPDAALRQQMERIIQKCISEKKSSPYICRASAYATALSQGYSPERAARLTNFKRTK